MVLFKSLWWLKVNAFYFSFICDLKVGQLAEFYNSKKHIGRSIKQMKPWYKEKQMWIFSPFFYFVLVPFFSSNQKEN